MLLYVPHQFTMAFGYLHHSDLASRFVGQFLPTAQCHIAVESSSYKVMALQSHCSHVSIYRHCLLGQEA